ncbi:Hypothetical predicted protein [Pelobates cultripes]|uniref:Uncharacterized protein n=1 Tax=Pelobates cultripes TaxID=61616 RepID=A0AAD1WNQ1_PELCU|nr:Hypothetical predicted protein [Pelobates cultripes]
MRREKAQIQSHMVAMEDRQRWKNIKIRGILKQISTAEIPHLIRRLLTHLFSSTHAKLMALDGCFRLSASLLHSPEVNGDIIVRF